MTVTPKVMHALHTVPDSPMIPGALYATLCGTEYEYQPIPAGEQRSTRFVCAMCHEKQMAELLTAITEMQERFNKHLQVLHGLEPNR